MDIEMIKGAIEAMLFVSGKPVSISTLCDILEMDKGEVIGALQNLEISLIERGSGLRLIKLEDSYQLTTLDTYYDYIVKLVDNRPKPTLSGAALEVLAIVAYNPKVTRAEMEKIRGVASDSAINKLIEYNLIEDAGRMDAPGRPVMYKTTEEFLRMFGYSSLKDLPELPKLKEELDQLELNGESGEVVDSNGDKPNDEMIKNTEE